MSSNPFRQATKARAKLRLALIGPSGSGKTYTALTLAQRLAAGGSVAVLDTERGSASLYADLFRFDVLELTSFHPRQYIDAIQAAAEAGYAVVVIDSLSHAWMGKDGALQLVDDAQARQTTRNSYTAWREVTPLHNALVDALVSAPIHVIATLRSKTEYVQEKDDRGKTVIRKVGLAPVQRDGLEYEFTVVAEMDQDNTLIVSKSRIPQIAAAVIRKPDANLADTLLTWLDAGSEPPAPQPSRIDQPPPMLQHQAIAAIAQAVGGHADRRGDLYQPDGDEPPDSIDDVRERTAFWTEAKRPYQDVHRIFGLSEQKGALKDFLEAEGKGWRWAKRELARLDALVQRRDAEQPALDGMPAAERERPEAAAGAH